MKPATCSCGWILPAAFKVLGRPVERGVALVPDVRVLLVACGNCGAWMPVNMGAGGAARTLNADGFGNMPSLESCRP